ncbi:hypothetical protein [Myceligenerans halotolerans]
MPRTLPPADGPVSVADGYIAARDAEALSAVVRRPFWWTTRSPDGVMLLQRARPGRWPVTREHGQVTTQIPARTIARSRRFGWLPAWDTSTIRITHSDDIAVPGWISRGGLLHRSQFLSIEQPSR